jgi:uncharacterized damage-inducible protein DinB
LIPAWLQDLFRQMEWADARVWRAVVALPAAVTDSVLAGKLYHTHIVQRAFLQIWRGGPPKIPEQSTFGKLRDLMDWARPYYAEAAAFLRGIDEKALLAPVVMPWAGQFAEESMPAVQTTSLAETIIQVTSHSTYHRGQSNMRLRQLGGEPPLTDFIAWVWFNRPEPDWPS